MNRNYTTGMTANAQFFIGTEIERTPAFGLKTLFVTGLHPVEEINNIFVKNAASHIFFGANHSFNPTGYDSWKAWETMIEWFLIRNHMCSLDIPIALAELTLDGDLNSYNNFIPQLRVPVPYIAQWNYNTMIKIDDKGFNSSNPGVWTHSLHEMQTRNNFTSWDQYSSDEIIK